MVDKYFKDFGQDRLLGNGTIIIRVCRIYSTPLNRGRTKADFHISGIPFKTRERIKI